MISPDVADAVTHLEGAQVLSPEQAALFRRVARGELLSLSACIHTLLYLGVVALTTGTGLLFKEQIANLGPLSIALGVGLVAALCFVWVSRQAGPFSRTEVAAPHFAFDYVLVLGGLLAAADLAFIESRFSPLGDAWSLHLLIVSLGYAALAFRFDSRTLFGLALTSFAAWRGVAAASVERAVFGFFDDTDAVRLNTLICGLLFIPIGRALKRRSLKAHFEPTATHLGWLLILQSIAWGIARDEGAGLHRLALMIVGSGLAAFAWRAGRFTLFVFGVLAAYLGFMAFLFAALDEPISILFLIAVSAIVLIVGLTVIHRRFPRSEDE